MRALAISDIHGRFPAFERALKNPCDLVILLGDIFCHYPYHPYAELLLRLGKPVIAIPGNNETPQDMEEFCEYVGGFCAHGVVVEVGGIKFVGLGGSPITPFDTIFEWSEEEAWRILQGIEVEGDFILLTHAPPAGTPLSLTLSGVEAGSVSIRRYIELRAPRLCLCGHVHENRGGECFLGKTKVMNCVGGRIVEI